ncbi:hypothetical protein [Mucisphaera sp.]|uniref:hypothetical protein n=1 Tax=Mucisphaera sp. TaxID=2913024 RepID=UPI003D143CDA
MNSTSHLTRRLGLATLCLSLIALPATPALAQPGEGPPPREHRDGQGRGMAGEREERPRFGRFGDRGGMSEEEARENLDAAIDMVREIDPELVPRLELFAERDPMRAMRLMSERFPRLRPMLELREQDPEMFSLRIRDHRLNVTTRRIAFRIRQAEQTEQGQDVIDGLEADLRDHVIEHFEVRQLIRERELAALEAEIQRLNEELDALRVEIDERAQDQTEIIDQRVDELLERDRVSF